MLVSLQQNIDICLEPLQTQHHSDHPQETCFEEPDQLVNIVSGYLLWLIQKEHSICVSCKEGSDRTSVLTRTDWKVGVTV